MDNNCEVVDFFSKRFCCIYTRQLGFIKSELLNINLQLYKLADI